jgi:hypothetical protein
MKSQFAVQFMMGKGSFGKYKDLPKERPAGS